MAKEIVAWCEVEFAQGEKVPGRAVVLALDNGKPMEIDLCEPHEKEYVEPLRLLLAESGQPVEPPKRGRPSNAQTGTTPAGAVSTAARTPYATCLFCGNPSKSKAAFGQHLKMRHDTLMSDPRVVEHLYGGTNPIEPRLEFQCDQCPISYDRKSSLSGHMTLAHGGDDDNA